QLELAVSRNQVYAGVVQLTNGLSQLTRIFRSDNLGTTWVFGPPTPGSTDQQNGVNRFFSINPGGQGFLHFSMAADPNTPNVVYVGGARQPVLSAGTSVNSIGANDFSGRLFRVDTAANNPGTQIVANGANGTSPHADSRALVFAGNNLY